MDNRKPWILVEELTPQWYDGRPVSYLPSRIYVFHQADFLFTERPYHFLPPVDLIGRYDTFILLLALEFNDGECTLCPGCLCREPEAERLARCD